MLKITVLLLFCTGSLYGQIINGGFEIWDTTYVACYDAVLRNGFSVSDPHGGIANSWPAFYHPLTTCGTARTTDSHSGRYALLLYNWYHYDYGMITYRKPIEHRPRYLQGFYKYITGGDGGLSHGIASVTLTRVDGTSRDTVATGSHRFDSTTTYTPFQIQLHYVSASTPDSIEIFIRSSDERCQRDMVCNLLYLDDLELSDTPLVVGGDGPPEYFEVTVYPNPFAYVATVRFNHHLRNSTIRVLDVLGRCVREIPDFSGSIFPLFRGSLQEGLYFLQLMDGHSVRSVHTLMVGG